MIRFFRTRDCKGCAAIQEALEELSLAHKVVVLDSKNDLPGEFAAAGPPPVLMDDKETIQGRERILAHLEKLAEFRELWYKFQSDACYCDEEGGIE